MRTLKYVIHERRVHLRTERKVDPEFEEEDMSMLTESNAVALAARTISSVF